ncbi:MAG: DUF4261 domain-containing protein [Ruminiclostridium sp.]|jgi:hypothetical protein|nr:DUF4261 domain-containing protein [Ruminiclostridium sp.]
MTAQEQAAAAVMEEWLSHPQELGKKPARLEIAGTFVLHELRYYIFKFKKSRLGSWKVAVCGGYEGDGVGHCGHIYSTMEDYDPATAQAKCEEMVERLRQYWMDRAKEEEEQKKDHPGGDFLGFVLLSTPEFDETAFRAVLKEDWGLTVPEQEAPEEGEGPAIVFEHEGMMVSVALMEAPVPNGEAEYWANSNFMERDQALAAARDHQSHLLVAVMGREAAPLKAGELFVKLAASCLKAPNALGIYDCGTVWLPEYFIRSSLAMKEGRPPLDALVFVGLYRGEKGVSSWTNGLRSFGKEELEVVESRHKPSEVYDLMWNVSSYLIQEGAVLRDGETLGYTAKQKLPITRSKGVYVEGQTLKIGF